MSKVRVTTDGTRAGTRVGLADGSFLGAPIGATVTDVEVRPASASGRRQVVVTFREGELVWTGEGPEPSSDVAWVAPDRRRAMPPVDDPRAPRERP